MLIFIERIIKQKIKVESLPEVSHVIAFKKKRLISKIQETLSWTGVKYYLDFAKQILEVWKPEEVISAILKECYNTEFDEEHYADVKEDVRISSGNSWQQRLFVAKWRNDNLTPGTLIQFLEKEVWEKTLRCMKNRSTQRVFFY